MKVILRKLQLKDAEISWKWRNDPKIWELTGRKWNNHVTKEIEENWIKKVNEEKDSIRFAICVGDENEYVGNVQLTNITKENAVFHIFIGNKNFWGKGIGQKATSLIIQYAKSKFFLNEISLSVKKDNKAAIKLYQNIGFHIVGVDNENILMIYKF